jgi:hypothetical protein
MKNETEINIVVKGNNVKWKIKKGKTFNKPDLNI